VARAWPAVAAAHVRELRRAWCGAGGLGIRTRVTRRSQAQPADPGRLDTSEFFEQARR